jgi:hypothetical protein
MHVFLIVGIRNSSEIPTLVLNAHFGHRSGSASVESGEEVVRVWHSPPKPGGGFVLSCSLPPTSAVRAFVVPEKGVRLLRSRLPVRAGLHVQGVRTREVPAPELLSAAHYVAVAKVWEQHRAGQKGDDAAEEVDSR